MILLSAGHHQLMKGASFEGFNEHDEALKWVSLIAHHMASDCMVIPAGTLKNKIEFINEVKSGTLAVEIHFNAAINSLGEHIGSGCETLHYPTSSIGRKLAQDVQKTLSNYFQPDRGVKEGWYRMNPENGPDFFLARTKMPAIIIEPEFIHNKKQIIEMREQCCISLAKTLISINEEIENDKERTFI